MNNTRKGNSVILAQFSVPIILSWSPINNNNNNNNEVICNNQKLLRGLGAPGTISSYIWFLSQYIKAQMNFPHVVHVFLLCGLKQYTEDWLSAEQKLNHIITRHPLRDAAHIKQNFTNEGGKNAFNPVNLCQIDKIKKTSHALWTGIPSPSSHTE